MFTMDLQIVFVSGHYPTDVPYAQVTRRLFQNYTNRHGYGFYYDDEAPPIDDREMHQLHYRRCLSILKAWKKFPSARWFVWVDSDVLVTKPDVRVESCIDLSDTSIQYHLFHEKPWDFPINTGVKFVNRDALFYESTIHAMRNTKPWNQFPYEQKAIAEYVIPKLDGKYIIHDPYVLNHILYQVRPEHHDPKDALFVHLCARSTEQRNNITHIFETENRLVDPSNDLWIHH